MDWMQVKDLLIFSSFEDFYADMVKHLTNRAVKIELNEDLRSLKDMRTEGLKDN